MTVTTRLVCVFPVDPTGLGLLLVYLGEAVTASSFHNGIINVSLSPTFLPSSTLPAKKHAH